MSRKRKPAAPPGAPHPLDFFGHLVWLDGTPLLKTVEPYRRAIFADVLYTFDPDGRPHYNLALCGRGKKNWKTSDLVLAALYRFLAWPSAQGNDSSILANDEGQAADDLSLAKADSGQSILGAEVDVRQKEIVRKDDKGKLLILPAKDVVGLHGKTFIFLGFDEIHGYRSHDLFEALAPDPTRLDVLTWITSYAGIRHAPGIPLYDFMRAGKRGDDPRMYFSWYAGDFTTDPKLTDADPEARANPSMVSWGNRDYLVQQKRRLPNHKYRRLHLNLPGAPDGAALSADQVVAAIQPGRRSQPYNPYFIYRAFVDMSGGSSDDAVLGIAHREPGDGARILDLLISQSGTTPFNSRHAVKKFAAALAEYRLTTVTGDAYAGETFRQDFAEHGISYKVSELSKSELYEAFDVQLNAGEVELLDIGQLQEQLLTLVWRGTKIDHQPGDHDDWANGAAGALVTLTARRPIAFGSIPASSGYRPADPIRFRQENIAPPPSEEPRVRRHKVLA